MNNKNELMETLQEFIETYNGFDWENGEIVVVDKVHDKVYLCKYGRERLIHPYHNMSDLMNENVWNYTHSFNTMVITLFDCTEE